MYAAAALCGWHYDCGVLAELEYDSMPELEYDSEPEFDLAAGGVGVSSESEVQQTDRFDVEDNYGEGRHAR